MKKFMFVLMAILLGGISKSFGQTTLVATLSHGEKITMYYGARAFSNAHSAAVSGDIITLSGGSFSGFTITKGITVRGTGVDATNPTKISSDLDINIPASDTCRFSMEGILGQNLFMSGKCSNPYFLKCKFKYVTFRNSSAFKNLLFVNCKFGDSSFYVDGANTIRCSHCFIYQYVNNSSSSTSKCEFINSVVRGALSYFNYSTFVNSIIIGFASNSNNLYLPGDTKVMNCVAIATSSNYTTYYGNNVYANLQGSYVDSYYTTYPLLFKNYTGGYSDSQTFELTDEAKAKYKGTDGTEVGLYGGAYPFSFTPAYPRINKMNVAKQTTADNKLSVEIEVSASE